MPGTIVEADWKVLRRVHPLALERYCERVLDALTMLARIRAAGLLTEDEFFSLSPETRNAIGLLMGAA